MEYLIGDLITCFDNIDHEINEYKIALVPRVLALSDDVEVNHALLWFEDVYSIIFYRKYFLKRYGPSSHWDKDNDKKYIALGENFVDPAFKSLADLLDSAAYLHELIQRKSELVPEMGIIEESVQGLKHRLLWYLKNDNMTAIVFQITSFLICFVLSSYVLATIFMH